ncbi:MAG: glucose-1-phosphate adenylyltransferase subunit GlgD [Oscillospiraceae bacterium]|jgi:glucose-1-phosphate adenylyltransferase|nr:glucose-1-phosphate adenylyltransferase subunit GlgD [Oscillospiraceae bacterium]
MRKEVFGIIYAGEENMDLRELINKRSVGALPVGGRYRVIDFVLSNMVNSGIRNIAVVPRKKYHSMMDHLGSGKEWDLNRKSDGLFILPPYDSEENHGNYRGMVDTLNGAASYLRSASQKYCLLSGAHTVYNDSYRAMFQRHIATGADITMMYNVEEGDASGADRYEDLRLATDSDGRIVDMKIRAAAGTYNKMSMGIYLIKKDLLQYLLDDAASRSQLSLAADVIMNNLGSLKVYGFEHKGYVGRLRSVSSYYKLNMDFLRPEVQQDLFYSGRNVYTKIKDEPPTKYGADAVIKNSLIGSGCEIDGTVENCVIFRGVKIAKGTVVKDSVIMQSSEIYSNSRLANVILDKKVTVRPNTTLAGSREYPVIIPKGANV